MDEDKRQAELKHFVEDLGLFFEQVGLPRMAGRVLGWLLVCNPPHQSMNELVDALLASKASISNTTRLLIQIGLIERLSLPGHRRDYFRIKPNAWYQLMKEEGAKLTAIRKLADRGLALLADEDDDFKGRLQEMRDMYAFFEVEWPALLNHWEQAQSEKN